MRKFLIFAFLILAERHSRRADALRERFGLLSSARARRFPRASGTVEAMACL